MIIWLIITKSYDLASQIFHYVEIIVRWIVTYNYLIWYNINTRVIG